MVGSDKKKFEKGRFPDWLKTFSNPRHSGKKFPDFSLTFEGFYKTSLTFSGFSLTAGNPAVVPED